MVKCVCKFASSRARYIAQGHVKQKKLNPHICRCLLSVKKRQLSLCSLVSLTSAASDFFFLFADHHLNLTLNPDVLPLVWLKPDRMRFQSLWKSTPHSPSPRVLLFCPLLENHEHCGGGAGAHDTMKTSLQVLRCQLLSE